MKSVVIYEEAKRMYLDGYSLDAIVELLKNTVSRKTLHNWKTEHKWDDQRKQHITLTADLTASLVEIAKVAIREAKANPTPHNIYAVVKAVSALKLFQGVELPGEAEAVKATGIKQETIALIERDILGM